MSAPELRVRAVPVGGTWTRICDVAGLVEPVTVSPTNRAWRRRVIQHVAALSGVPARDVARELSFAERSRR